jgi:hypothetical protein
LASPSRIIGGAYHEESSRADFGVARARIKIGLA